MSLPLEDVRVLALEQYGAGPWATLQLADLGAEVIKVEDPRSSGDVGRYVPPFQSGKDSLFFETFNRNKKSISLDLRRPESRMPFEDLVRRSDAVYSNLRGDQPVRLGLTYRDLCGVNPRIVCCSLSGFGMSGPRSAQGGYDYMMQGLAGWMSLTGEPNAPPTKTGLSLVDLTGGYVSTIALLAGLSQARREGIGCDCDVSLFESALAQLCYIATWAASSDYRATRHAHSAHPSIVPFQNFESADGWLVIACPKQKFFEQLCVAIGRPELVEDGQFTDFAQRYRNRASLLEIIEPLIRKYPTEYWLERLGSAGIPCAQINDVAGALADLQVEHRKAVVEYEHSRLGRVRQVATPLRVGTGPAPLRPAPARGEHTKQVLADVCGYTSQQVADLAAAGVFG